MRVVPIDAVTAADRKEEADRLREIADRVEHGEVIEWVVVCNDASGPFFERNASFKDRWRMLGALEYARQAVHDSE